MSIVAETIDEKEYASLLSKTLPRVIHTEDENQRCTAELESLLAKRNRTPEELRLAELLTLLIEDFEDKHYALPAASPVDIVRHLMDANGLRQVDLKDVFGSPSIASEVLNGKRDFSKAHIDRLSKRFHVSPEIFFSRSTNKSPFTKSNQEKSL
jgi:HTH-type transcriptional regulator / antitoxin HigA